jgi:hypothetical protein
MIYPFSQFFSCNSLGATQAELLLLKFDFDSISKSDRSEINKDVLGLHPKNPISTSLVLKYHSTD